MTNYKELQAIKDRLELVLEGTRLGMWDWNPMNNEVVFDERWASMLGLHLSDLTQTLDDWQSRVHPDDIEQCFKDITDHIEGNVAFYENTHRMMHTDGNWRYILDRGCVMERNAHGEPIRFTGTHTDVTDLKLAELKAVEALESRNDFFAKISHEIRTPLHGIISTTDILKRLEQSEESSELISIISQSGNVLMALLNDLLDFSKIQHDSLTVTKKPFDVLITLEFIIKLFEKNASSKGLLLEFTPPESYATLIVDNDETRLTQVISNIISNAVKFTQQGIISLSVDVEKDDISITIKDTGMGIKDLDKAFELYSQEENISEVKGTGIGLPLVKSLCEAQGIELHCESYYEQGTLFRLTMPRTNKRIEITTPSSELLLPQTKYDRALIVDDNNINLIIGKKILKQLFENVDIADSGSQAIELISKGTKYDFVFMDLNMPNMDGVEATKGILEIDSSIKVFAQTADTTETTRQRILANNFTGIIQKPYTVEDINESILSL
jgi:signal transduction histidine kinase/CheY-like chemotaxis protein